MTTKAMTLSERLINQERQLETMLPAEAFGAFGMYATSLGANEYPRAIRAGQVAPRFELPDAHGRTVRLEELLSHGPVVIAFYRGNWCPYCNLQLHAYQEALPAIQARGAQMVAISPQTSDHSLTTAEKWGLGFHVLSDVGSYVAERYGIVFAIEGTIADTHRSVGVNLSEFNGSPAWRLPVPATYVVAPTGVVSAAWIDGDYRRRTEPADILAALDSVR